MKITKRNSLIWFGLVWLNSSKLNFETCLCSTEPNYQSHHLWFFFLSSLTNLWFGLFSIDKSTTNSTNDFNGKKQNYFFETKTTIKKSLSLFVLWIDLWFLMIFSTNKKESWFFFWFCQPNQPFDTSFSQIKSNQINWL
jgi:hypothetical protein